MMVYILSIKGFTGRNLLNYILGWVDLKLRRIAVVGALLTVGVCGCSRPESVVLLDTGWDARATTYLCKNTLRCAGDPGLLVRDFELTLKTQFAAQEGCRSVQLLSYESPNSSPEVDKARQKQYWTLSLNFVPGASQQGWQIIESERHNLLQGDGSAADIAREVCGIVTKKGATLTN